MWELGRQGQGSVEVIMAMGKVKGDLDEEIKRWKVGLQKVDIKDGYLSMRRRWSTRTGG